MKKIIISIVFALIVGFSFGFIFLKKFNVSNNEDTYVYAFQLGVYSNYDNALNISNINNGIIVSDDTSYHVYSAILNDLDIISNLKDLYDSEGISYYIKKIDVSDESLSIINDYEILLRSTNIDKYQMILKELMKELGKNEL